MSGRSGRCFLKVLCGSIEPIKPQVAQGYLKPSASLLTGMLPAAHTSDLYLYLFLSLSLSLLNDEMPVFLPIQVLPHSVIQILIRSPPAF